ncbi:hypothetical protein GWK47_033291 [Chionoecetes opilio]|uniref:Uncharacterized protein n=1 Tax=Chionoecetes opilio TaxID=41210 RepID=A0A8J4YH09_CHIOP|nr:hypothetical protein GWK47_033291 [Chionoecetes opilio]
MTGIPTFDDYARGVFFPHMGQRETSMEKILGRGRVPGKHIKEKNREKRGKGYEGKVQAQPKVPGNLGPFSLLPQTNKVKLFFPYQRVVPLPPQTEKRLCKSGPLICSGMTRCRLPRKADKELWVLYKCPREGCTTAWYAGDTDFLVILGSITSSRNSSADIGVAFGSGKISFFPTHKCP